MAEKDLTKLFLGATEAVDRRLREGVGALPAVTADGQESSKLVVPTVEAKTEAVPVSSGEIEEQALQTFIDSIHDGSLVCLTNEKGTPSFYKKVGNQLRGGKAGRGKDSTKKVFDQKNAGCEVTIEPKNSAASSSKDLTQQAGEPATTPAGASSAQAEKVAKPEVSKDLSRALDRLRKGLGTIIDTIETPLEYASFRKAHPDKLHFFRFNVVENEIGRTIEPAEKLRMYDLEIELEKRTFEKFQTLKEADLQMQFDRENARITASKNVGDSDRLLEAWGKKLNVTFIWKDVLHDLPEDEARIASADYKEYLSQLSRNFRIKREEFFREVETAIYSTLDEKAASAKKLFDSSSADEAQKKVQKERYKKFLGYLKILERETKVAFKKRNIDELRALLEKAKSAVFKLEEPKREVGVEKELTNEELFSLLVNDEDFKEGKSFGRDRAGKELIIESVSDTEIKYRYGEAIVVTTPADARLLLSLLKEDYGWLPMALRKKKSLPASTEPASATAGELAGTTLDIDESGAMNPSGSLNVSVDGNEPAVPVAKDKVANKKNTLRGVAMKPVMAHNIFDSNPFEGLNDSEEESEEGSEEEPMTPEEERYEELENLLDPAEQWSISGIVGDTLGTVLIYSRKKGKLKGNIIDEMGGMDFVAEKILMPAIQKVLPSEWSEDDKKFYSRESALDYLDLFVEEYEEETEK